MSLVAQKIIELLHGEDLFTDINLAPGQPILCRTPSGYRALEDEELTGDDIAEFLALPGMGGPNWRARMTDAGGSFDVAQTFSSSRLRCSAYETDGGEHNIRVALRRLPLEVPPLAQLGTPRQLEAVTARGKGLFLITGPTGAGKTTTLAAMLDFVNQSRAVHIQTIEKPIEYILHRKKSVVSQCEVPTNVASFGAGINAALRHRPDIIAIGEIHDRETVTEMLHAASSGHLVLATMHTNSCEETIAALLQFYDGPEAVQKRILLSSALVGIVSQALLPSVSGDQLVLACELLLSNQPIAQTIRDGKFHHLRNAMRDGRTEGMKTLNDSLNELVHDRKISVSTARKAAYTSEGLFSA